MQMQLTEIDRYGGAFRVEYENIASPLGGTTRYYVSEVDGERRVEIGDGSDGKRLARTLAATLAKADVESLDLLPPEFGPEKQGNGWESWVSESVPVPVTVAASGRAASAGWLKVVYRMREKWIGNEIGVSEDTVVQYLSDLREGRR